MIWFLRYLYDLAHIQLFFIIIINKTVAIILYYCNYFNCLLTLAFLMLLLLILLVVFIINIIDLILVKIRISVFFSIAMIRGNIIAIMLQLLLSFWSLRVVFFFITTQWSYGIPWITWTFTLWFGFLFPLVVKTICCLSSVPNVGTFHLPNLDLLA